MSARGYRFVVTIVLFVIGLFYLSPLDDIPFDRYLISQVRENKNQFDVLIDYAQSKVDAKEEPHLMSALLNLCHERHLDLSKYFTQFNIADIKNIDKKNQILLRHLLAKSHSVFKKGLDLKGGVAFSLEINQQVLVGKSDFERERLVQKAVEVILSRIDALGVAEPIVRPRGYGNIEVQLPGVSLESNPDIVYALKKPAKLDFKLVNDNIKEGDPIPLGYEKLFITHEDEAGKEVQYPIVVKKIPEMTGKAIKEAHPMVDSYGKYEISLQMTGEGTERFATITRQNLHRRLAIVLDGKVCSAPVIQSEITGGQASISGHFTQREAIELSNVLNNPLEFELDLVEVYEVGPSLASGLKSVTYSAALFSTILVFGLMILVYKQAGAIGSVGLVMNFAFIIIAWVMLGVTITLPSITALALTFGMAVDANILIYERVSEEMRARHNLTKALSSGHEKAFVAIFDSNVTTLLTACLLIWLGTGSVKGFGVTLAIGIVTTLFTVLCFNRSLLEYFDSINIITWPCDSILNGRVFKFMKCRKVAFYISGVLFLCSILALVYRGKHVLGIDFVGGEEIVIHSSVQLDCQEVCNLAKVAQLGEVSAVHQKNAESDMILMKVQTETGKSSQVFKMLQDKFPEAELQCVAKNKMGASVSSEVQKNSIFSVIIALIIMLMYVAFRFEFSYGVSAVMALAHDTFITIGLYAMLGHQFTAPMVAAVLMVIGYSINDTIIVFDRIREELQKSDILGLRQVIDIAISRTLSRTFMTSLTTLVPAFVLYLMCSGVVGDYALIFLIGVCVGTFSSVFIASPIFYYLNKGDIKRAQRKFFQKI